VPASTIAAWTHATGRITKAGRKDLRYALAEAGKHACVDHLRWKMKIRKWSKWEEKRKNLLVSRSLGGESSLFWPLKWGVDGILVPRVGVDPTTKGLLAQNRLFQNPIQKTFLRVLSLGCL
jgi:hypothetical protein